MSENFVEFCSVTSPCEGWQRKSIQNLRRPDKYEDPILAVCELKFVKFRKAVGGSFVVSNAVPRLSMAWFFPKIFVIKSRSRRETTKSIQFFGPQFFGRDDPIFYGILLAPFISYRMTEFGWVSLKSICCASLTMKQNAKFASVRSKFCFYFSASKDQRSWNFDPLYESSCSFQRFSLVVAIALSSWSNNVVVIADISLLPELSTFEIFYPMM